MRESLKSSAHTYNKLYVRSRRRKVEEGADHAAILLLVYKLSILIRIQHGRSGNRSRHRLAVSYVKAMKKILCVLALMNEDLFFQLFDLKIKGKCQLVHHTYFELIR